MNIHRSVIYVYLNFYSEKWTDSIAYLNFITFVTLVLSLNSKLFAEEIPNSREQGRREKWHKYLIELLMQIIYNKEQCNFMLAGRKENSSNSSPFQSTTDTRMAELLPFVNKFKD